MAVTSFLLDTNVLSELMKAQPDTRVLTWFEQQRQASFYTSTITQAEVLTGAALLPRGKRRDQLAQAAEQLFVRQFAGRCLAFDGVAAQQYALIRAHSKHQGRPMQTEDAMIAAIALVAQLPVVTRNTKDFQSVPGLALHNPWQASI